MSGGTSASPRRTHSRSAILRDARGGGLLRIRPSAARGDGLLRIRPSAARRGGLLTG